MLQTQNRFDTKKTSRYIIAKLLKTKEKETAFKQLQGEVQMPSKSNNATTADILPETMEAQRLGMTTYSAKQSTVTVSLYSSQRNRDVFRQMKGQNSLPASWH